MTHPELGVVGETALTPLYAKANAHRIAPGAGLRDPLAESLLEQVGYDPARVLTDHSNAAGAIYRTLAIDHATIGFAVHHHDPQIVSVGLGLCTRHDRLAAQVPEGTTWVGVDTADVIALRRRLLPDDPVTLLSESVATSDWAAGIDAGRPTMVIAEGLLMYLDQAGLASLIASIPAHFGPGTEVVGDYFHPRIALSGRHPIVKATGAQFRSGARNGAALAALGPGLRLIHEYPVMERLGRPQHLAARAFRLVTRGGRPYSVAHLRVEDPHR